MKNLIFLLLIPFSLFSQNTFLETFDGDPNEPESLYGIANWATYVHARDRQYDLNVTISQHGPNCEPPVLIGDEPYDTIHINTAFEETIYRCKNHMMTAIRMDGYGLANVIPNAMVDLSNGSATVRVDISTWDQAEIGRDWFTVTIVPPADFNPLTASEWSADLEGRSRNSIWIETDYSNGVRYFALAMTDNNFNEVRMPIADYVGLEDLIEVSKTQRTPFIIEIATNHLKLGIELPDGNIFWYVDADEDVDGNPIQLTWDKAMVMLGHYSYNPRKSGVGIENTWHWDNLLIEPSIPLQIIGSNARYANPDQPTISFNSPATANCKMVFNAPDLTRIADSLRVSFDNGLNWQYPARILAGAYDPDDTWGASFTSMQINVPLGATTATFTGIGNTWQDWMARDVFLFDTVADTPLSIEEEEKPSTVKKASTKLNIYPNPTSSTLNVDFMAPPYEWIEIDLLDVMGQKIKGLFKGHSQNSRYFREQIALPSTIHSGFYFIRVKVGNAYWFRKIIIE